MPTPEEYRYCTRLGMTQTECAAHLGISRAAVTKAKARLHLVFGDGMAVSQGKQWEMEFFRYPWDKMAVGDWVEVQAVSENSASILAFRASKKHHPRTFRSFTRGCQPIIWRAA